MPTEWARYRIWCFAAGYFGFYVPYSALTKSLSNGTLFGDGVTVSGFELLPATLIGTVVTVYTALSLMRWWKYAEVREVYRLRLPLPGLWVAISGLGTAGIIATTTLAYTFDGVSIVLALLLMRGGVLAMSPMLDFLFRRKVHWYSWLALALCLTAVTVALADTANHALAIAVVINLVCYLGGYALRLQSMTRMAKCEDRLITRRYFVEEQLVSMPVLILVPAFVAVFGTGEIAGALRTGFTAGLGSGMTLAALGIGILYGCLFMFGSFIYLEYRENTFCVPVNRCSSLLAGVVAGGALTVLFDQPPVNTSHLIGVALIFAAVCVLFLATWQPEMRISPAGMCRAVAQRLLIFVCGGNTSRSPMASAICASIITGSLTRESLVPGVVRTSSAGIAADPGAPMTGEAERALRELGIGVPAHSARNLTEDTVRDADAIFCMTAAQHKALVTRFPNAEAKIFRLDPECDIVNPAGQGLDAFHRCAEQIRKALSMRLPELAFRVI